MIQRTDCIFKLRTISAVVNSTNFPRIHAVYLARAKIWWPFVSYAEPAAIHGLHALFLIGSSHRQLFTCQFRNGADNETPLTLILRIDRTDVMSGPSRTSIHVWVSRQLRHRLASNRDFMISATVNTWSGKPLLQSISKNTKGLNSDFNLLRRQFSQPVGQY